MGPNLNFQWHDEIMQVFFILIIIFFHCILEGPPQFGSTLDSVTIGYRKSVNSRVMYVQITDFGDFIQNMELDYDNEYYYFDTRLRTYWEYLLQ